MASTSTIESVVAQSQQDNFTFSTSHNIENGTTLSPEFDWDSWNTELKISPVYKAAIFIQKYYPYILSAIGVPCNMLSFLVMKRITPLTSALLIMMILAVADSLMLMLAASDLMMRMIRITYTNTVCCVILTALYFLHYMPIWLVVFLTLERVVAVCFPMKAAQVCTISNVRQSIVILFILDIIICIGHTFIYEERHVATTSGCAPKVEYEQFYGQLIVVDGIFFAFIPLILLCVCNMSIILKLRSSRGIHNETTGSSISEENKRQNRSVTAMLLVVSITTIICLGPNLMISLIGSQWYVSNNVTPSTFAMRYLTLWIMMLFTHANNAINFFLYILSGRRFRTELYNMVTSWFGTPMRHFQQ